VAFVVIEHIDNNLILMNSPAIKGIQPYHLV